MSARNYVIHAVRKTLTTFISTIAGTFSALPLTMGTMNAFLKWATSGEAREVYRAVGAKFDKWIVDTNDALKKESLPIAVHNLTTVWTIIFNQPGRYHWMFQYYLRAEGIALSWVGTGRLLVSLDFGDEDFAVCRYGLIQARRLRTLPDCLSALHTSQVHCSA